MGIDETKIVEGVTSAVIKSIIDFFKPRKKEPRYTEEDIKKLTNILFIDDEDFPYIKIIGDAGWNVSQIYDLKNLDDEHVQRADVIFLDFKGVGKTLSPAQEGIGILKALKNKYPTKPIVFYSAHVGFSLGDEFGEADDWLAKSADPIVYLEKIEEYAKKKFGL